jgi:hypothetical protein
MAKPTDGDWLAWVNRHYPFDEDWERHLLTRAEHPEPGSKEQLNDLRGLVCREMAAQLAEKWFSGFENQEQVLRDQRLDREKEREKERCRMIRIAKLALECKLGETREDREAAQATAQRMLGNNVPDQCDFHELRDWERMHRYARAVARGENPPKPTLWRERKQRAQQRREIEELDDAIGAAPAGKPRTQYEQQGFGQW